MDNIYSIKNGAAISQSFSCDILVPMEVHEDLLYKELGERLLQRRLDLKLTQAQVADRAQILRTSVANFETAKQRVPLHVLYRLCAALELDVSSVLPTISDVVRGSVEAVDIEGTVVNVPPRAAETLRQLHRQLTQVTETNEGERSERG